MVFFILSGVVLSFVPFKRLRDRRGSSGYDWLGYYPRRIVRLCVPLFSAIILAVPAGYVAWRVGSTSRSALAVAYDGGLSQVVHDLLMQFDVLFNVSDGVENLFGAPLARLDSPVWSMSWELWFSLTLPLAIWCVSRIRHTGRAVVAMFVMVFISHWSGYFPLRLCLMFWFGVLIAKHFDRIKNVDIPVPLELLIVAVSVCAIEAQLLWTPGGVAQALLMTARDIACFAIVLVSIADGFVRRALSTSPMVFLGKISYSLYLTHAILIGGLVAFLPRVGIASPLATAGVSIVVCAVFAVAFWRAVEVPSMKFSRRLAVSEPASSSR